MNPLLRATPATQSNAVRSYVRRALVLGIVCTLLTIKFGAIQEPGLSWLASSTLALLKWFGSWFAVLAALAVRRPASPASRAATKGLFLLGAGLAVSGFSRGLGWIGLMLDFGFDWGPRYSLPTVMLGVAGVITAHRAWRHPDSQTPPSHAGRDFWRIALPATLGLAVGQALPPGGLGADTNPYLFPTILGPWAAAPLIWIGCFQLRARALRPDAWPWIKWLCFAAIAFSSPVLRTWRGDPYALSLHGTELALLGTVIIIAFARVRSWHQNLIQEADSDD